MGSQQSTPQLTLAEKRYRIGSPERTKKQKKSLQKQPKKKISSNSGILTTDSGLSIPVVKARSKSNSNYVLSRSNTVETRSCASSRSSSDLNSLSLSAYSINGMNNNELLSRPQRVLVENSWKRSRKSGADNVGTKIFLLVLTAQPDIKEIFGLEKIPQGRLKYDPRFRKHAVVYNRTFDYIVKNLSYTEKLVQHFQALGRKHVLFQGRGFLPQYWDTFAECMTQTAIEWEGGQRCRETMIAWRTLVTFIIKQMRHGFDEENKNRRKFPSLTPTPSLGMSSLNSYSSVKQSISPCPMGKCPMDFGNSSMPKRPENLQLLQQQQQPEFSECIEQYKLLLQEVNENEDDDGFYTPPTTKRALSSSFSGLSITDFEENGTNIPEETWASPRKHFSLKTLHLVDP